MKLKISNLEKAFDGKTVLKDINIDLEHFRSLAIIGPSGGGKSTLLRMLAGLQRPDRGEIHINGERIDYSETLLHEYRKTIGVVFQSYNLFPHLTALDNITLPLTVVHKFSKEKAKIIALDLLDRFQLKVHVESIIMMTSSGQKGK